MVGKYFIIELQIVVEWMRETGADNERDFNQQNGLL
jgi:hypothetical protein